MARRPIIFRIFEKRLFRAWIVHYNATYEVKVLDQDRMRFSLIVPAEVIATVCDTPSITAVTPTVPAPNRLIIIVAPSTVPFAKVINTFDDELISA